MRRIRPLLFSVLIPAVLGLAPSISLADVHTVKINEYYTQCDDGSTDVQYIELRSTTIGNLFRRCALLEVKRVAAGAAVFLASPVFAGRGDNEDFPSGGTFLIATPAFQALTGVVPDLLMPNGTLDPAGGVIRFAAEGNCFFEWGTIHEVQYGDQGPAPAPGANRAANYRVATNTYSVGNPSPRNFAGSTASSWTCAPVPAESRTWGSIKRLF